MKIKQTFLPILFSIVFVMCMIVSCGVGEGANESNINETKQGETADFESEIESIAAETAVQEPDAIQVASLKEYFFTDSNRTGSYLPKTQPSDEPAPPDGLIQWERIPQSNRTAVLDKLYSIRLTAEAGADDYGNYCGMSYCHYMDAETKRESLLVYLDSPTVVDLILVFETDFGSTEQLRRAVAEGTYFTARLTQCVNGNTIDGTVKGVGYIGNHFSTNHLTDLPDASYQASVAISAGYLDSQTGNTLTFDLIEPDNEKLVQFVQFVRNYGITMNPTSDLTKAE